ncbi:MAG: hypothetical protein ACK4N6_04220, partial [Rhodocyclaceae bacterium]
MIAANAYSIRCYVPSASADCWTAESCGPLMRLRSMECALISGSSDKKVMNWSSHEKFEGYLFMEKRMLRHARSFAILATSLSLLTSMSTLAAEGGLSAVKVEFTATPAPTAGDDLLKTYTTSVAKVTFADGSTRDYPLSYVSLFKNTDRLVTVKGRKYAAGQIFDKGMNPVMEPKGDPALSETPDANSLLQIGSKLFLVTHWEYDDVLADGRVARKTREWYSRMPMHMSLSELAQDNRSGKLKVKWQQPIDFSVVNGGWTFCAGSQTPWNSH